MGSEESVIFVFFVSSLLLTCSCGYVTLSQSFMRRAAHSVLLAPGAADSSRGTPTPLTRYTTLRAARVSRSPPGRAIGCTS
jgi:hypothetical protein